MPIYGLIGFPLSHSFSPEYFQNKFLRQGIEDAEYHLFPLERITEFPALVKKIPLGGLNVTIPYKTSIIPYLDELDTVSFAVGAVNTIQFRKRQGNLYMKGFNTDVTGFRESLLPYLQPHHQKALIMGTGGAALAVAYVLKELGIQYQLLGRLATKPGVLSYAELIPEDILQSNLIINATPAGKTGSPNALPCASLGPLFKATIGRQHLLYDLVYNPDATPFLQIGKEQGAVIKNGMEMLHLQAEASWKIWNTLADDDAH
jgi:shikimate dehydrogenase